MIEDKEQDAQTIVCEVSDSLVESGKESIGTADGFDEALVGVGVRGSETVALYSVSKSVKMLCDNDGMASWCGCVTEWDAFQFLMENIIEDWGSEPGMPIWVFDGEWAAQL